MTDKPHTIFRVGPRSLLIILIACGALLSASISSATPQAARAPHYTEVARNVVTELSTGKFDAVFEQFDRTRSSKLSPERIGGTWHLLTRQFGAFRRIESVQVVARRYHHVATVTCAFQNARLKILLYLDSDGRIAGMHIARARSMVATAAAASWSAPPYAHPHTFHEEAVTITDGRWRLPGTLTLPNGPGPFPAVVLVGGSGPSDADETVGLTKPFKDLAWGLASRGIAVLRYPKRTRVYGARSSANPRTFTVKDEYIDDARAAVALLASHAAIDPTRIVLAGHSEGGYLAPRIAAGDPQIAGIIILEGPTRPIQQAVVRQLEYLAKQAGSNAPQYAHAIAQAKAQARIIDSPNLKPGTMVKLLGARVPSSYFLDLRHYNPCAVAARLKIPIYVTQGGRDYQVTTTDFANWRKALAGHANVTLKLYPSLDHLLLAGTGPSRPSEYFVPGQHVAAAVVRDLAAWIKTTIHGRHK